MARANSITIELSIPDARALYALLTTASPKNRMVDVIEELEANLVASDFEEAMRLRGKEAPHESDQD